MAGHAAPHGDIMTPDMSNHASKEKGLNSDDYSFTRGSIPGATQLKLKDVLDSKILDKKKTVVISESPIEKKIAPDIEKPMTNKNMLGDREVNTVRAFKSDINQVEDYLSEMRKHAYSMGYVERYGRGNKGPRLCFTYALHYKLKGLDPEDAAREFMEERDIKKIKKY